MIGPCDLPGIVHRWPRAFGDSVQSMASARTTWFDWLNEFAMKPKSIATLKPWRQDSAWGFDARHWNAKDAIKMHCKARQHPLRPSQTAGSIERPQCSTKHISGSGGGGILTCHPPQKPKNGCIMSNGGDKGSRFSTKWAPPTSLITYKMIFPKNMKQEIHGISTLLNDLAIHHASYKSKSSTVYKMMEPGCFLLKDWISTICMVVGCWVLYKKQFQKPFVLNMSHIKW